MTFKEIKNELTKEQKLELEKAAAEIVAEDEYDPDAPLGMPTEEEE